MKITPATLAVLFATGLVIGTTGYADAQTRFQIPLKGLKASNGSQDTQTTPGSSTGDQAGSSTGDQAGVPDSGPPPLVVTSTGSDQTFVGLSNYKMVTFEVWSSGGQSGQFGGHGGGGSYAQGTFPVVPGATYKLKVGVGGGVTLGYPYGGNGTTRQGGSGGGGSFVYQNNTLLVAAGSGGGGGAHINSLISLSSGYAIHGADGDSSAVAVNDSGCTAGGSATANGPGTTTPVDNSQFSNSSSGFSGGNSYSQSYGGSGSSGGGGGYYGGGGGSVCNKIVGGSIPAWYMPGGGGSSYVAPSASGALIVPGFNGAPQYMGQDYINGVGVGGTSTGNWTTMTNGGPGLIVVRYSN